jgi:carboxyl-terminal processing protease
MNLFFSRRRMKALGAFGAGLALTLGLTTAASAEPRVALVIGNSAYQGDLPALPNPANDAKLMARTLKSVGFDVVEAEDASQDDIKKAIAAFSEKLAAAGPEGTGLFFYAGHGVQVAGENYLIPVDAKIKREADVDLVAVSASTVLKQMEFANTAVNIIILDACRNNPLGDGARSMSRGLAKIETAPRGSFIAYSTAPGSTAADGDGVNSPYTTALASTITEPGLSIADVFQEVRTKVLASTNNEQTPWDSSSLTGRFYFKAPEAQAAGAPSAEDALKTEKTYWDSVKDSGDAEDIQLYLNKYPNGYFVDLANAKLAELKGGAKVASAASPAQGAPSQPAARPSAGASFIAQNQTVYAKAGGQVRARPDGKAEMVGKLKTNTEVAATGISTDGKWWRVALPDGQTGYMHESVVSEQPLQTAAAQPVQAPQPAAQPPQPKPEEQPNGAGLEMVSSRAAPAPAPAPAGGGVDVQSLGQAASAIQSGNIGQASAALNSLFGSGAASGQQAALPQIQFLELNSTVTVKKGALIRSNPMFNAAAVATASQDTRLQARGRTANKLWWQVVLPDGSFGYVEGRQIRQEQ